MKNNIRLILISIGILSFLRCTNHVERKQDSTDTTTKSVNGKSTSSNQKEISQENNSSNTLELLQGKWQHVEDKTNYLEFTGNHRRETAAGMDGWDDETFVLSDRCINESDTSREMKIEKDRYISCPKSDLCWYIDFLDKDHLSLVYMARGNILTYKRVK